MTTSTNHPPATITGYISTKFPDHTFKEVKTRDGIFLEMDGRRTSIKLDEYDFAEITQDVLGDISDRVSKFAVGMVLPD